MKKQLFIAVLFAFSWGMLLSCSSDEKEEEKEEHGENGTELPEIITEPLVQEGKTWLMDYELVVPGRPHTFIETLLKGDTVINGIHYMKSYRRTWREDEEMPQDWTAIKHYYAQDGGKVYMYDGYMDYTFPIVDFSLEVGDIFTYTDPYIEEGYDLIGEGYKLRVTAVSDTILDKASEQVRRKCLYLESVNDPTEKHVWVDGIGSVEFGIIGIEYTYDGARKHMMKCSESDRVLYQYE